ncbi:integrin alpha-L [Eublepharis macularius]|uniref:Integrin alpha-L n=1 Tax=Eublepharis macularius TaxID=481883 RepID=A0AA97K4N7_EUBMA|nr:integrin alpha-L [Eublepharis macularius]
MAGLPLRFHFLTLVIGSTLQGPSPSLGYNINTSPSAATLFSSNTSTQFGYEVLQIGEGPEARIIIGAPGEQNSTGHVYQCTMQSEECQDIPLAGGSGVSHLGMTLASNSQRSKMIVCGPGVAQHCDKNIFMSGICYLFDAQLQEPKNIITGYQECLKGNVDLVFLFDGSESLKSEEFNLIKQFMIDVMEKLRNSTIKFAAVQFSYDISIEFDFNNYTNNPNPRDLLANVAHKKSTTNTFKAIKFVAEKVFVPKRGTREGANRVMVIITDGDATDSDNGGVKIAKAKKILRFIIGIGSYFPKDVSQAKIAKIASKPTERFLRVLTSFENLKDSFNEIQGKIYDIEDTSDSASFYLEMSSSGFSADISQGRVVLGAVGANNWAGGLLEQQEGLTQEKFINVSSAREEMKAAYLGYALKFLQHQKRELYAVGAPRYQHVGRVLVFEVNPSINNWTLQQEIPGEQIGSYFGAVLCSVDVDSNGETDLLLVGAPMYFKDTRGGRVYVYGWAQDDLALLGELQGDLEYPLGRFGAAIADLADINGDGLTDVAVGAPLEDGENGVVYIYNGNEKTVQMHYSQKIKGANISPGLKYFGRSIHGKTDLSQDGLTDIAVGALGKAVVLCSRPIVTVAPTVQFWPQEIPVKEVECLGNASSWKAVRISLNICFNTSLATEHYKGLLSANLSFHLEIDRNRMKNRGVFGNGKKVKEGTQIISLGSVCIQETIHIPNCLEDYISDIKVFVNFSLNDDSNQNKRDLGPILNPLSNTTTVEIPFEKNCGEDEVCEADLRVLFHASGSENLLLSSAFVLKVVLELENLGEDAYHAVLHLFHVPGLSFRKASVRNPKALIILNCDGIPVSQGLKNLVCNVSHPIYRENTKALIELWFDVLENSTWGDNVEMEAYVSSNNEKNDTLHDNKATRRIPVQYPINIIVKGLETSVQYINFSSVHQENKTVMHSYEVKNIPWGAFPPAAVTVFVKVPTTFPAGLIWEVDSVRAEDSAICELVQMDNSTVKTNAIKDRPHLIEQCAVDKYHIYQCSLGQIQSSVISVTGTVYATSKIERFSQSSFCTASWLTFDTRRYSNQYGTQYAQSQVTTKVDMIFVMDYLPIIIGSAIGGLFLLILIIVGLYKCGFFKRNYKDKMDHEGEAENVFQPEGNPEDDEGKVVPLNGEAESK